MTLDSRLPALSFCGDCYACRSIASGDQPEFAVIRPAGTQIKVEQLDAASGVLYKMSLHPVHLPYRILVIDDAHCLNEETANQMLKLLEEPPQRSIFILTSDRPPLARKTAEDVEGILPTISSRSLKLQLQPLPRWQLEELLVEDAPEADARARREAAYLAGGRYVDALALASSAPWREACAGLAAALARGRDVLERAGAAQDFEFAALWAKELADSGLSDDEAQKLVEKPRQNELKRQALSLAYDRATWWLLHEAARGLETYTEAERRSSTAPALPGPHFGPALALLKQRISGNVDPQLAQAAFEGSL